MKEMIFEMLELLGKKRWLKIIEKETNKSRKLAERLNRSRYVVIQLVNRYNELYGDELKIKVKSVE